MSRFRYSRFVPDPVADVDLDDLIDQLKHHFLRSGFDDPFDLRPPGSANLMQMLAQALAGHPLVPEAWRDELASYARDPVRFQLSPEVREFLERLLQRLVAKGYLAPAETDAAEGTGSVGEPGEVHIEFQLTDRSLDLLGYRMLRKLLGSIGRSSHGLHETDDLATGVQADAVSRRYEFGDTLNLDISATLLNAVRREGLGVPIPLEYGDLMVHQTSRVCSCATVLMLDCSHSMILYGEDRFTPAKSVALALAHLIRVQFPGDSLEVVLFHDSAERVPLVKLPAVQVGPYHTNTCEGLRLARHLLLGQRREMRQIVMITDGKPSALTLPDGRIYRNAWGLDPLILEKTFDEVALCRRGGILINTFMLARDYQLVQFVKRVAQISRGKAYFTSVFNLADFILLDFMKKRSTMVH